jgi:hypothetical protein
MIPLFFSILPLCVIPIQETPKEIQNFAHCLNSEKKIEQVIEWEPLISKYFKEEDRAEALLIVYCESRGKPTAVGTNTNDTKDVGLWQFKDYTWSWLKSKRKITRKTTHPGGSTAVASWL